MTLNPFKLIKGFLEKIAAKKAAKLIKETNMWKFLEGKKTYLVMAVTIVLGALDSYNQHCMATETCKAFTIPGFVFSILAALGIYTRSVAKTEK